MCAAGFLVYDSKGKLVEKTITDVSRLVYGLYISKYYVVGFRIDW